MLIPQFSLRWLLSLVTGCSLAFLVVSFAVRGHIWAVGASIGLLSLVVVALLHGFTFFLVWLFATLTTRRKVRNTSRKATICMLSALLAAEAYAGGAAHTLPPTGKPAPNGMVLVLDTTWPEGFGYRPVTITVNCRPPATADRSLSFEVRYHDWNPDNTQFKATADLDLPAGATTASTTIAVPDFSVWQGYSLDTWEDGRHVPQLSQKSLNGGGGFGFGTTNESAPAVLLIGAAQPDVTELASLFPQPQYRPVPAAPPGSPAVFPPEWAWRPAASLPEHWLCYQSLDVVLVSLSDLEGLAKKSPKVLVALRDWARAGGNLLVFGVGSDWKGLAALDRMLGLASQTTSETQSVERSWESPKPGHYSNTFTDFVSPNIDPSQVSQVDEQGNAVVSSSAGPPPAMAPFRWRNVQQGAVLAIANDDPYATGLSADLWYWMFNSLGSARWLGVKRLGVSFTEENPDFWMFLISGVGMAPVDAYRVLITAFVVFIGPVNYLLLRKHGRLHLLLFTVPVSALVVTTVLLGYALIADGLHTRVRSRSITLLDQRLHEAVFWSRAAYYSGLAPSGGLRLDGDTAVIPLENMPPAAGGAQISRTIDIEPGRQQLSRGWLPSRTPTQLMMVKPYVSFKALNVTSGANQSMIVDNGLGVRIQHLLVCDEQGQFGCGNRIPDGTQATLERLASPSSDAAATSGPTPTTTAPPAAEMRKAFSDQALALPPGFSGETRYSIFGFQRRMIYRAMGGKTVGVGQATNRLEASLEFARSAVLQAGASGDSAALTPRSYIAIVDRPEEVALGLDGATESQGFHVIRGSW